MKSSQSSSGVANTNIQQDELQGQAGARQHDGYQWTALSVTTVGALLASIQGSALLIALPNILGELHATFFSIMWVLLGYLLILTVLTPVVGRLADLWGRKRLYNSGFIAFTIGSLIAGLAQPQFHAADLIVGRVIQGVGAALLVTNSTVIVTDAFRKGQIEEKFGGRIFRIDVGMTPPVNYSKGALLFIDRQGGTDVATSLDADGTRKELWRGPAAG